MNPGVGFIDGAAGKTVPQRPLEDRSAPPEPGCWRGTSSNLSCLLQVSEAGREQKVEAQNRREEEDAESRVQRGKLHICHIPACSSGSPKSPQISACEQQERSHLRWSVGSLQLHMRCFLRQIPTISVSAVGRSDPDLIRRLFRLFPGGGRSCLSCPDGASCSQL